jgi:hypothetical protein
MSKNLTLQKELSLIVIGVNERPTLLTITKANPVEETAAVNTIVATLTVIDPDSGDIISCDVIPANAPFKVVNVDKEKNILNIVVSKKLDYETAPKYDLKIQCTDGEFKIEKVSIVDTAELYFVRLPASSFSGISDFRTRLTDQRLTDQSLLVQASN